MPTLKSIRGHGTVSTALVEAGQHRVDASCEGVQHGHLVSMLCMELCSTFTWWRCLGAASVPGGLASARKTPYTSDRGTALPGSTRKAHKHRQQACHAAA